MRLTKLLNAGKLPPLMVNPPFFFGKATHTFLSILFYIPNMRLSKLNAGCVNRRVQHLCLNSSPSNNTTLKKSFEIEKYC